MTTAKQRRHNGLVLLSGGGRKVQPIEIEVAANVYRLLLLSFEKPMQETTAERICEIAADLHRKFHQWGWYHKSALLRLNIQTEVARRKRMKVLLAKKTKNNSLFETPFDVIEERHFQSVISSGGF